MVLLYRGMAHAAFQTVHLERKENSAQCRYSLAVSPGRHSAGASHGGVHRVGGSLSRGWTAGIAVKSGAVNTGSVRAVGLAMRPGDACHPVSLCDLTHTDQPWPAVG